MVITNDDVNYRLSGGQANESPAASLGGAISDTIYEDPINMLFDRVEVAEASAGDIEYRCIFFRNNHATQAGDTIRVWIAVETPSPDSEIAIGLDPAGAGEDAAVIANESTAPTGVNFTRPLTFATGLLIPVLNAQEAIAIWIRRTISAGAAVTADSYELLARGETDP